MSEVIQFPGPLPGPLPEPDWTAVWELPAPPWERDEFTARRFDRLIEIEREREILPMGKICPPRLRVVR